MVTYSKTNKKFETSTLWLHMAKQIKNKKYDKYISVDINVTIMEISKYDLSYMRYYIVTDIIELMIIF